MDKLKIGIIGVGRMGSYHVNMINGIETAILLGVYDLRSENSERIAKEFKTKAYKDADSLIKDSDAIILASDTSTHYEMAKKIIGASKHLLIEKPITPSYAQSKEIVELARDKKIVLHVGHVERFNGAVLELENVVNSPYLWEARRVGPVGRIVDVGVIWDLMIHDVDICLRTLKSEVKRIDTYVVRKPGSKHEDVANATVAFENGCVANFITSRASQKKDRSLNISQKDDYLLLDFNTQDLSIYRNNDSVVKTSSSDIRYSQTTNFERLYVIKRNPLELQDRHFINAIMENTPSYENNLMDLKTIEITEQIFANIRN